MVCGIAGAAFEIAAAEVALGCSATIWIRTRILTFIVAALDLHVAGHGLDAGAASQFAFDGAKDAAPLSQDEDTAWILRIVVAISLVDIGALDLTAGEPLPSKPCS